MMSSIIDLDDAQRVRGVIDAYRDGRASLSGLELYYELERSTSLLTFHTMLREGARNRSRSGLQQSYGDHNRLLMLGLDKLVEGDLDWYRSRIATGHAVSDEALVRCFRRVAALELSRDSLVALWLAAALHDCGMLCGRGAYVDVEDGVVLSRPIIDALCPEGLRDLALFVLHHHDYIKGVFLGEVPPSLLAAELDALPQDQRAIAMVALGCVQVAGAASLGEGRVEAFRIDVFDRCSDGAALDDRRPSIRFARLLAPTPSAELPPAAVAPAGLAPLLESAAVHGWQRVTADVAPGARAALLAELAARWEASGADHVVFADGFDARSFGPALDQSRVETARSGVTLLTVGP
jgi:hypothetical protein